MPDHRGRKLTVAPRNEVYKSYTRQDPGMDNGDWLTATSQTLVNYGVLVLLAVLALGALAIAWLYRQQSNSQRELQRELQGLRFELDDHNMQPGSSRQRQRQPMHSDPGPGTGRNTGETGMASSLSSPQLAAQSVQAPRATHRLHAELELQAYQKIWASLRELHDKLGSFLRAIESGEGISETRLAARTSALKAKDCAQRLRPFYPENIEALVFQLIDNEVHMHLSACAYLDAHENVKSGKAEKSDSAYQSLRDESKLIYDGECRQQLNTIVQAIRYRLANQAVVD
tara:strand:- start:1536 stop:2393 length:858 start_codon:yes stop_codon:yes gene_type:complete